MKEVRNIQVLRGIAAIAVIFYHTRIWEAKAVGDKGISPGFFSLGESGVDLFFVISGFIMAYIQPSPLADAGSYKRFMVHRVTRVYPPYWIVSLILLPVFFIQPELFNNFYHHKMDLVRSFLLLPQDYTPLLGVGWTLIHEVYFYIITSLILVFSYGWRFALSLCWFSVVLLTFWIFGQNDFGGNRTLQVVFSPFSLTFLLGFFVGLLYSKFRFERPWLGALLVLLSVCGMIWVQSLHLQWGVYPNNNSLLRLLYFGAPSALLVAGAVLLEGATQKRFRSLLHLGNESYGVYLLHLLVLSVIYKLVARFPAPSHALLAGAIFSEVICSIVLAAVFHRFVELPSIKICRSFLERRLGMPKSGGGYGKTPTPHAG